MNVPFFSFRSSFSAASADISPKNHLPPIERTLKTPITLFCRRNARLGQEVDDAIEERVEALQRAEPLEDFHPVVDRYFFVLHCSS